MSPTASPEGASAAVGSTAAPDPYLPGAGTNAYRVERYELELDYRVSSNRLSGRAVLHGIAQVPASAIVLDLTGLRPVCQRCGYRQELWHLPRTVSGVELVQVVPPDLDGGEVAGHGLGLLVGPRLPA